MRKLLCQGYPKPWEQNAFRTQLSCENIKFFFLVLKQKTLSKPDVYSETLHYPWIPSLSM